MTNRDKIEQFLQTNPDFNEWYFISEVEDNLFIYYIGFVDDAISLDGIYNCSVNQDDTIYYIRHIHNTI